MKLGTAVTLLALVAAVNLCILGIRVHSLLEQGSLTSTTGIEGPMVYSVWKVRHNHQLYEAPGLMFSNTLYNFLYYETSALTAKAFNADGDGLLLSSRLTTGAFAILGAIIGLVTVASLSLLRGKVHIVLAASAMALFWFGTSPVGWWSMTARPDVGAVCLASLGLLCFLRFLEGDSIGILLLSSISFFLAWSFKQSIVSTFVGTVIASFLYRRNWRVLLALIAPFVLGVLAALYIGGGNYRFNILTVPTLGAFAPSNAVVFGLKAAAQNPILYITPILALAVLLLREKSNGEAGRESAALRFQVRVIGTIYLCTLAGGAFLCLRSGSDINYFLEAGMAGSIALLPSAILLFNWNKSVSGWFFTLASVMVAGVCLLQLAAFFAPRLQGRIPGKSAFFRSSTFGRLRLLTAREDDERRQLAGIMAAAPKPVLIIDDIFSQPWHSTNDSYPAFVIDPSILGNLQRRGFEKDDRIATLIKLKRFRTVVISEPSHILAARQNGYGYVTAGPDGLQVFGLK